VLHRKEVVTYVTRNRVDSVGVIGGRRSNDLHRHLIECCVIDPPCMNS